MNTAETPPETGDEPLCQTCATCGALIDISDEEPLARIVCPACGAGEIVSGQVAHFELQEVVGHGGMGVVYKAYDAGLDRFVALKLLRRDKSKNREVVSQLAKEASITASINHPHVVRVFTSGTDHGRFFLAMELVDKGTLDDLIKLQGKVAETQALEVGIQIAQGLRAALQAGLIHRDVKPGNILFSDAHTSKIVDFGLAIFMEDEEKQRGEVWGTPYYVAPEKLEQQPEDFRSDMYSLGGTLFHALAGRPPFEAENASMVALKHLKSQAVSLQAFAPHVSGETAYVINRTLSKNPNDRYQSYDELIEHLEYALEQLRAHGGKPQPKKRVVLEDEEQQKAMGWFTAVMFGVILLVAIGVFAMRKKLFPGSSEAASAPPVAASGKPAGAFAEARAKLMDGDAAGAIASYREQAKNQKLAPLSLAWANYGEGIAQLVAGKPQEASRAFQEIVDRPIFTGPPEEEKIDTFQRETARKLASPLPVSPADAKSLNSTNYELLGLLAFALKDWQLGRVDDAAAMLRQFRSATPAGRDAWVTEYKLLSTQFLEDYAAYGMAKDQIKAAKGGPKAAQALAALKKMRPPFPALATELEKNAPAPAALPRLGEWTQSPLGEPAQAPAASLNAASGVFTVKADGADFWATADQGHFIHRTLDGDGEIVARVVSLAPANEWTKAGLMVRGSLNPGARNAALLLTAGNGVVQQMRDKPGQATINVKADGKAPQWLKLVRKGDTFTGYRSDDGQDWKQVAAFHLAALPAKVEAGLALTAHDPAAMATAKFDRVALTPAR